MSDDDLIQRFVDAVDHLSPREAADASGINPTTITLWRNGSRSPIIRQTRRKLRDYLDQQQKGAVGVVAGPIALPQRLDQMERDADGDLVLLTFARAELAAVIRADAMREGGTAARIEAEAARERAVAMREWAAVAREEVRSARIRRDDLRGGKPTLSLDQLPPPNNGEGQERSG